MGCFHSCFGFRQPQTAASGRNCLCGNAAGLLRAALWLRRGPFPSRRARRAPALVAERLGGVSGGFGGVARGATRREREKEREPSRAAQATVPPAPFELGSLLPAAPLAAPRVALCLFRRGHCHENGIFVSRGASTRSRRAGCKDTGGTELAAPTCPCSGSLSPPQLAAEPRFAPARAPRVAGLPPCAASPPSPPGPSSVPEEPLGPPCPVPEPLGSPPLGGAALRRVAFGGAASAVLK